MLRYSADSDPSHRIHSVQSDKSCTATWQWSDSLWSKLWFSWTILNSTTEVSMFWGVETSNQYKCWYMKSKWATNRPDHKQKPEKKSTTHKTQTFLQSASPMMNDCNCWLNLIKLFLSCSPCITFPSLHNCSLCCHLLLVGAVGTITLHAAWSLSLPRPTNSHRQSCMSLTLPRVFPDPPESI